MKPAPSIEESTRSDRLWYIKDRFPCIADCDQCGFCAPGYIMTILAMEKEVSAPVSEETVQAYLAGNLCRCTGYRSKLRAAVKYLNRSENGTV